MKITDGRGRRGQGLGPDPSEGVRSGRGTRPPPEKLTQVFLK